MWRRKYCNTGFKAPLFGKRRWACQFSSKLCTCTCTRGGRIWIGGWIAARGSLGPCEHYHIPLLVFLAASSMPSFWNPRYVISSWREGGGKGKTKPEKRAVFFQFNTMYMFSWHIGGFLHVPFGIFRICSLKEPKTRTFRLTSQTHFPNQMAALIPVFFTRLGTQYAHSPFLTQISFGPPLSSVLLFQIRHQKGCQNLAVTAKDCQDFAEFNELLAWIRTLSFFRGLEPYEISRTCSSDPQESRLPSPGLKMSSLSCVSRFRTAGGKNLNNIIKVVPYKSEFGSLQCFRKREEDSESLKSFFLKSGLSSWMQIDLGQKKN